MSELSSNSESDLPAPTVPEFQISLQGFTDEAQAREFGDILGETIRCISRMINLERLDGITVAYNYDEALAHLDRGFQSSRPLTRTSDDRLLGVGMAVPVLRDRVVKGHLVLSAPFVMPLQHEDNESFEQALYLIAHECGHIEDLKVMVETFPDTILQQQITDYEDVVLEQMSTGLWQEYAACRTSARLGRGYTGAYEEGFVAALMDARKDARAAIRSYRLHHDIDRVLEEAGRCACQPIRMAAYLSGHLDGIDAGWDAAPQAWDTLVSSQQRPHIDRLIVILRSLWADRGRWKSREDFRPLHGLVRDVLADAGLILKRLPDGRLYVDIPFTSDTLP